MSKQSSDSDLGTPFITRAVRRRWKLITMCALIGMLAGTGYIATAHSSHTANAQVLVSPIIGNAYSDQSTTSTSGVTIAMQTEAGTVGSQPVTEAVNAKLGLHLDPAPFGLLTSVPTNTQIVDISYTASRADQAKAIAQAFAEQYLARRAALARTAQQTRLTALDAVAKQVSAALAAAATKAATDPTAAAQVQVYISQLSSVQTEIGDARAVDTSPGAVLTPATLAASGSTMRTLVGVLGGLLVGLLVGVVLAAWRERRDDRIYADDPRGAGDVAILGAIDSGPVPIPDDQLRLARLAVELGTIAPAVVAVTPLSADVPVDVAARLAAGLHRAGHRVVLVDARVSGAPSPIQLPAGPGLADLAEFDQEADDMTGQPALQTVDGLRVLGAGTAPGVAQDRYTPRFLERLFARLRTEADYVIVVTAPVDEPAGISLTAAVTAALLVAAERRSTYREVAQCAAALASEQTKALGLLVLRPTKSKNRATPVTVEQLPPAAVRPVAPASQPASAWRYALRAPTDAASDERDDRADDERVEPAEVVSAVAEPGEATARLHRKQTGR